MIEITFRTLKGLVFKLAADQSETILQLKEKVAKHQNVENHSAYRLIYKGKILQDNATISSCNITPAGFVVVMPPKKLPTKSKTSITGSSSTSQATSLGKPSSDLKPTPSSTSAAKENMVFKDEDTKMGDVAAATQSSKNSTEPSASVNKKSSGAAATADSGSLQSNSSQAASTLVTGSAYDDSVKRICEMGFPEDQVKKALRAAFNNPDRAVEFLFSGIPEVPQVTSTTPPVDHSVDSPAQNTETSSPTTSTRLDEQTVSGARSAQQSVLPQGTPFDMFAAPDTIGNPNLTSERTAGAVNAADGGSNNTGGNLDFLRELPLFSQIRRLVQANPAALPQILQQLSSLHPDLIPLIDANQDEFSRLINEPVRDGEFQSDDALDQLAQALADGGAGITPSQTGSGGSVRGGNPTQIYVTAEERDQINRLNDFARPFGLAQGQVLETWLACGRNEDLTANFLFDHADELRADRADDQNQPEENNGGNEDRTQERQDDSESPPRGPQP